MRRVLKLGLVLVLKKNVGIIITEMMGPGAGISKNGNYAFGKSFQL